MKFLGVSLLILGNFIGCSAPADLPIISDYLTVVRIGYIPSYDDSKTNLGFSTSGHILITDSGGYHSEKFYEVFKTKDDVLVTLKIPELFPKLKEGDVIPFSYSIFRQTATLCRNKLYILPISYTLKGRTYYLKQCGFADDNANGTCINWSPCE